MFLSRCVFWGVSSLQKLGLGKLQPSQRFGNLFGRRLWGWVVACFFMGWFEGTAFSATVVRLTETQMLERSSLVVRGKVLFVVSFWNKPQTAIVTQVTIQVRSELLGRPTPKRIVVGHYGGTVGAQTMELGGGPRFVVGEEVVLFLHPNAHLSDEFLLTGWTQGKWELSAPRASFSPQTPEDKQWLIAQPQTAISWEGPLAKQAWRTKPLSLHLFKQRIQAVWTHLQKVRSLRAKKARHPSPQKRTLLRRKRTLQVPLRKDPAKKPQGRALQGGGDK
ncbi:MAG: hypothetical protein H6727_14610 [Myxococcales bacterium]|nr:hypothetical protein [Myxococcales bacterium]